MISLSSPEAQQIHSEIETSQEVAPHIVGNLIQALASQVNEQTPLFQQILSDSIRNTQPSPNRDLTSQVDVPYIGRFPEHLEVNPIPASQRPVAGREYLPAELPVRYLTDLTDMQRTSLLMMYKNGQEGKVTPAMAIMNRLFARYTKQKDQSDIIKNLNKEIRESAADGYQSTYITTKEGKKTTAGYILLPETQTGIQKQAEQYIPNQNEFAQLHIFMRNIHQFSPSSSAIIETNIESSATSNNTTARLSVIHLANGLQKMQELLEQGPVGNDLITFLTSDENGARLSEMKAILEQFQENPLFTELTTFIQRQSFVAKQRFIQEGDTTSLSVTDLISAIDERPNHRKVVGIVGQAIAQLASQPEMLQAALQQNREIVSNLPNSLSSKIVIPQYGTHELVFETSPEARMVTFTEDELATLDPLVTYIRNKYQYDRDRFNDILGGPAGREALPRIKNPQIAQEALVRLRSALVDLANTNPKTFHKQVEDIFTKHSLPHLEQTVYTLLDVPFEYSGKFIYSS